MAKTKQIPVEREYIINLRREIMKVPRYKRTPKALKAIKEFIAKHMRVAERDIKKVKIDKWLNQELWFRGIKNPPTKIKIKAKKQGDNIYVSLSEIPEKLKFQIAREEKSKKEAEKIKKEKKELEETEKKEKELIEKEKQDKEEKKDEEKDKKEEIEKEEAVKEAEEKIFESQAKQMKHAQFQKEKKFQPRRMALQK